MMAKTRDEQNAVEPFIYSPRFEDEDPVLYDYHTGLPVYEAEASMTSQMRLADESKAPAALPAAGKSLEDLPPKSQYSDDVITIEVE